MYWRDLGRVSEFKRRQLFEFWLNVLATYSQTHFNPEKTWVWRVSYWLEMFSQSKLQSYREKKISLHGLLPKWNSRVISEICWNQPGCRVLTPPSFSEDVCAEEYSDWQTVLLSDIPFWTHLFKEVFFLLEECEGIGQEKIAPRTPLLCVLAKWLSHIWLFATPGTLAHQTPLLWDYPGKNTGVGVHLLLQGIYRGVKSQANIPTQAHF